MSRLPSVIETKRFSLSWLSPDDLRELSERGVWGEIANPCQLLTAQEAGLAEFFANRIEQNPAHTTWTIRGIIDRERKALVGHAGFHLAPDSEGLVEVGYCVGEAFRRQGIAKEAVTGLLAAARDSGEVNVIRGCTAPTNEISRHLLQALGFTYSGMVDDEQDGPEEVYLLPLGGDGTVS